MCTKIAKLLRGKYKPSFTPNQDCGDYVIVINASGIELTGNKWTGRQYVRYTGYPGGQREYTPQDLKDKGADLLIKKVVKGMLPKNALGRQMFKKLKVYAGAEHEHAAQKPEVLNFEA